MVVLVALVEVLLAGETVAVRAKMATARRPSPSSSVPRCDQRFIPLVISEEMMAWWHLVSSQTHVLGIPSWARVSGQNLGKTILRISFPLLDLLIPLLLYSYLN
jgi:hypothetical protein